MQAYHTVLCIIIVLLLGPQLEKVFGFWDLPWAAKLTVQDRMSRVTVGEAPWLGMDRVHMAVALDKVSVYYLIIMRNWLISTRARILYIDIILI